MDACVHQKGKIFIILDPQLLTSTDAWGPAGILDWNSKAGTKLPDMVQMCNPVGGGSLLQSGSDPQESLQLFTQRRDSDKEPRAVCKGSQSLCLWRNSLGLVWHQNLTLEADHRRILNSFSNRCRQTVTKREALASDTRTAPVPRSHAPPLV